MEQTYLEKKRLEKIKQEQDEYFKLHPTNPNDYVYVEGFGWYPKGGWTINF